MQNGFIESCNGSFRDECLNETLFSTLKKARIRITHWKEDYNTQRPHSAPGNITPAEFAMKRTQENEPHEATNQPKDSPHNRREVGAQVSPPFPTRMWCGGAGGLQAAIDGFSASILPGARHVGIPCESLSGFALGGHHRRSMLRIDGTEYRVGSARPLVGQTTRRTKNNLLC